MRINEIHPIERKNRKLQNKEEKKWIAYKKIVAQCERFWKLKLSCTQTSSQSWLHN